MSTIGPLWDGNEVWLVVAAAAMFAAFPGWYATLFSGAYLAIVLLLVALILRGVSFEYRDKNPAQRWRRNWSRLLVSASVLAPLMIGIVLGDLLHGLPIGANHEYTGNFWDLLQPYSILVGVALVSLCLLHGSTFIALKTEGAIRYRAGKFARRIAPVTALLVLAFIAWTHVTAGGGAFLNPVEFLAILGVLFAWAVVRGHEGWAFTATSITIALSIITIFVDLYPRVMVSSTNPAYSLTVHNSASTPYSLKVMTVIALVTSADRAGLPVLDVLRVPPPDQRQVVPALADHPPGRVGDRRHGGRIRTRRGGRDADRPARRAAAGRPAATLAAVAGGLRGPTP